MHDQAAPAAEHTPDVPEPPDDRPTADRDAVDRARTDGGTRALIANAMWRRDTVPSTAAQTGGYVWEFADRIAELAVPEIERRVREQVAADMKRAAAGRRDYATRAPDHIAAELEGEARVFDTAARVAADPREVMWGLLPASMWTDADRPADREEAR